MAISELNVREVDFQPEKEPVNTRRPSGARPWEEIFVPRRFRHATLENYEINEHNRAMYETVNSYLSTFNAYTTRGLLLSGTVGTGKTHLAFAIGKRLVDLGYWPRYRNFTRICIDLKRAWSRKESDAEIKDPLLAHSPLILDDLGAEMRDRQDQGWVSELVYEIFETRYENMLATIVITNLNLDDIAERYTDRVASRIAEMCRASWVSGYDYRVGR